MRTKANRGFTLVEIMVSGGIMIIAVLATCSMLLEGQRFTRNTEEVVQSNDNARVAGELITSALRIAGMGGGLGVWVSDGGTPRLISPIFGSDNIPSLSLTDDVWMIIPDRSALQNSDQCAPIVSSGVTKAGGAATIVQGGRGALNVNCTIGLLPAGVTSPAMLLVTNFAAPGVVLTHPTLTTASDGSLGGPVGVINYNEAALGGYPPRPYQLGDMVYGASVVRFFVQRDASGRPALYRQTGVLTGAAPPAFVPATMTQSVVVYDIEDLQIAYGVDPGALNLPDGYVFSDGFQYNFQQPLRSVRVSVVSIHPRQMLDGDNSVIATYGPMRVENHDTLGAATDGHRRSLYSRRVELTNLSPGAL
jgi:type II secretory pathway pseudopilin PulG